MKATVSHSKFSRRQLLQGGAAAGAVTLAAPMINTGLFSVFAEEPEKRYSRRALDLLGRSTVVDMLGLLTLNDAESARWMSPTGMTDPELQRFRDSGITMMHHAYGLAGPNVFQDAVSYLATWSGVIGRYRDHFCLVTNCGDIAKAKTEGKLAVLLGIQNADHFRVPDDVALFYNMGQRAAQLTYNSQNFIGSGATDRVDGGVSDYGATIISRMNEVGMLIDVSHCGDRTTLDAIEISAKPIGITHSNCKALNNHPRLKTDEAIVKLAAKGGVMGVTGVRNFVHDKEPTTIGHLIDHIDHVVKIAGIDHIGIGSDADLLGYDALPLDVQHEIKGQYKSSYGFRHKLEIEGFDHPRKFFDLTEALIRRGYSDDNIEAILGGNFKRLMLETIG